MSGARYLEGVLALALVVMGVMGCGVGLRRRVLPDRHGPEARLAELFLAATALAVILEVLGTVRLFRLVPIVVACLGAGAAALGGRPAFSAALGGRPAFSAALGRREAFSAAPLRVTPAAGVALLAGGIVAAEWLTSTLNSYAHGIRTLDSLWYHLPWAVSYAQTGEITSLRFTDVEYLTSFYPALAETVHGAGIVLLGGDALSPLLNLGWLGGCLLAGWCLAGLPGVLAIALALGAPMMDLSQAGSAANDVTGIFFLLCALVFWRSSRGGLTGAAAGLAIATKLSLAAPALAVAAATRLPRRWVPAILAAGGYWYLRNLIAVGNPLPWVSIPGLATPAPPLQDATAYSVAHYLLSGHFISHYAVPGLRAGLGPAWPLVLAAAVLGPLAAMRRRETRALGVVAVVSLIAYVLTPESAAGPAGDPQGFAFNLRYAGPALALCMLTVATLTPRSAYPLAGLLLVTLLRGSLWTRGAEAAVIAAAVIGGALGLRALLGAGRRQRRSAAVPVAVCGVALVLGGYALQRSYLRHRYGVTRVSQMSVAWSYMRRIHHARVGVVGTYGGFFAYPLTGLDGSNSLAYVGRRGANGSFTPLRTCASFRRALRGLDYLVATPARDPWHPRRLQPSPEAGWLAGEPVVLRRHGIVVFRLRGAPPPCG